MPDFATFSDLFRVGRDEVLLRNGRISRDAVEREGADANILIASMAAVGDQVVGQLATVEAATFLESAQGAALERLVFDRYGLVRKPAAASLGTVQFSTTAPAPTTFTIPVGVRLQTADGVQFVTTESVIFLAGSIGPVACAARSVLAGRGQNVVASAVNSITTPISSQPPDLVVTNPFASAGGDEAENDDSLRDRARRFFTTARRGTLGALEAAALGVPGVRKASAFEVLDSLGRPARVVELVVADAFTEQFVNYDTVPPRYQVQSQLLATTVFNALAEVRPAGTFVNVLVANVVLQAFQLSLTFTAGADVNTAALQARATTVAFVNALKPGESFVLADLLAAIANVPGLAVSGNNVASPAGNVSVRPTQVLRTSLGLVAATAAQTDQPIIVTGNNPDAFILGSA